MPKPKKQSYKRRTSKESKQESTRKKNIGVRLYEDSQSYFLLVPTDGIWLFKEQRTTTATLRRAGLVSDEKRPGMLWSKWKQHHGDGFLDYLRGKPAPDDIELITPSEHRKYGSSD